jgi:hypothetical protein
MNSLLTIDQLSSDMMWHICTYSFEGDAAALATPGNGLDQALSGLGGLPAATATTSVGETFAEASSAALTTSPAAEASFFLCF